MPKILKMPAPKRAPQPPPATPTPDNVVEFPQKEQAADLDKINRWVNPGDEALGNERKKA